MSNLHDSSIIIDGLNISKFDRSVFEDMRKGGVTAVNCTVSVWEDFQKTIDNIAEMKQQIREYSEILTLVRTTDDILRAKKENKTGIIFGFQNSYAFEDNLGYIEVATTPRTWSAPVAMSRTAVSRVMAAKSFRK
jgi:membrane dipeptidase